MNPLDNAQMTSQIAQINTVTGIQQLNETVKGLAGQFAAQQLMQGSAMVGRNVLIADNTLAMDATTPARWRRLRTGAALPQACRCRSSTPTRSWWARWSWARSRKAATTSNGMHRHTPAPPTAFQGARRQRQTAVDATPLSVDQVTAVSLDNGALALQLSRGGSTNYNAIKAIL